MGARRKVIGLSTCGVLGIAALVSYFKGGLHIRSDNNLPDFYYFNTKNINLSNEELLDEFTKLLENNEKLNHELDSVYTEIKDFILENGSYLDQEELLDTISELEVVYEHKDENYIFSNSKASDGYYTSIVGYYSFPENKIYFNKDIMDEMDDYFSNDNNEVKLHEVIHYMFFQGFCYSFWNINGRALSLDEGFTDIVTEEYGYDNIANEYDNCNYYTKALCEIIGPEKYLEIYGNHDFTALIDELSIYLDAGQANTLIDKIDDVFYEHSYQAKLEAWNLIEEAYLNKHNKTIDENNDLVMKYLRFKLNHTEEEYLDMKIEDMRLKKNYFVSKNDTSYVEIYTNDGIVDRIYLDDNNKVKTLRLN